MKHSFFRMTLCLTAAAASMLLAGIRTGGGGVMQPGGIR